MSWLRRRRYWVVSVVACCGCLVGLKYMMPIEKERAQEQQARARDIKNLTDSVRAELPAEGGENAKQSLKVIDDLATDVQNGAVLSERWHAAGEEIVGPPPEVIAPGSDEEKGVLVIAEREAQTMGKVRGLVNTGKALVGAGQQGTGGLSGWLMGGGLTAVVAALGGATELGRRKLKSMEEQRQAEREEDQHKQEKLQEDRDRMQDEKLNTMMAVMNARLDDLQKKLEHKA